MVSIVIEVAILFAITYFLTVAQTGFFFIPNLSVSIIVLFSSYLVIRIYYLVRGEEDAGIPLLSWVGLWISMILLYNAFEYSEYLVSDWEIGRILAAIIVIVAAGTAFGFRIGK